MIVTHDAFRGITGAFDSSIPLLEEARRLGLSTQINISIGHHNEHQLPALAAIGRYAMTGDAFGSDPTCVFQPPAAAAHEGPPRRSCS